MKTPIFFCCMLSLITSCVFTLEAESTLGEVMGYIALAISMVVFSKNIMGRMNA